MQLTPDALTAVAGSNAKIYESKGASFPLANQFFWQGIGEITPPAVSGGELVSVRKAHQLLLMTMTRYGNTESDILYGIREHLSMAARIFS